MSSWPGGDVCAETLHLSAETRPSSAARRSSCQQQPSLLSPLGSSVVSLKRINLPPPPLTVTVDSLLFITAGPIAKLFTEPPSVNSQGCKQFRDRSQQRAWPPSNVHTHAHTGANFWHSAAPGRVSASLAATGADTDGIGGPFSSTMPLFVCLSSSSSPCLSVSRPLHLAYML